MTTGTQVQCPPFFGDDVSENIILCYVLNLHQQLLNTTKTMHILLKIIALSALLYNPSTNKSTTRVVVEINNLRNTEGTVRLGVFKDNASFEAEDEFMSKAFSKATAKNGKLTVKLDLPSGTYGIALLDDENKNAKMDYSWMIPQEGFGFSNHWHTGLTKPDLDDFSFTVTKVSQTVRIKVKYL